MSSKTLPRREFLRIAGLTSGSLVVGACAAPVAPSSASAGTSASAGSTSPTGELRVGLATFTKESFDPILDTQFVNAVPIFDSLLTSKVAELQPGLAERWEVAPDGLSWTLYIRKGVRFHNGDELTAKDVKFSLERFASKDSVLADMRNQLDRVELVNDYTVRVYTKGQRPFFAHTLAYFLPGHGLVMPKDYIERNGVENFRRQPIGSGSFKFVNRIAGDTIRYEAVDKHWRQVPAFKDLTYFQVPEESTREGMLKTKAADLIDTDLESSVGLEASGFRTRAWLYEQVNLTLQYPYDPRAAGLPIADIRVRKALSLAINRSEIRKSLFKGKAEPSAFHGVSSIGADIDYDYWVNYARQIYGYDPQEASRLIKEAGYPNGFGIKLYSAASGGAPYFNKLAAVIQSYWLAIGVRAELIPMDDATFKAKINFIGDPGFIGNASLHAGSMHPVPATRLRSLFHSEGPIPEFGAGGPGAKRSAFPEVDKLIDGSLVEMDQAKRRKMLEQVIKIAMDSFTHIGLLQVPALIALGPQVDFDLPQATPGLGWYFNTAKHRK